MNSSKAYQIIRDVYGDYAAHRTGVKLIHHIDEGLAILDAIGASERVKDAFCIHPITQNGIDIPAATELDCYPLALEYAEKANAYLCRPDTDWVNEVFDIDNLVGRMSGDCARMLYADKIQNRKDFRRFHQGTHPRSDELTHYFDLWIEYLRSFYCLVDF